MAWIQPRQKEFWEKEKFVARVDSNIAVWYTFILGGLNRFIFDNLDDLLLLHPATGKEKSAESQSRIKDMFNDMLSASNNNFSHLVISMIVQIKASIEQQIKINDPLLKPIKERGYENAGHESQKYLIWISFRTVLSQILFQPNSDSPRSKNSQLRSKLILHLNSEYNTLRG